MSEPSFSREGWELIVERFLLPLDILDAIDGAGDFPRDSFMDRACICVEI